MAQKGDHRSAIGVADGFHSVTINGFTYLPDAIVRALDRTSSGRSKRYAWLNSARKMAYSACQQCS